MATKEEIKVWNSAAREFQEPPRTLTEFYQDIERICKKWNYSISHEDGHGAFIIKQYNEDDMEWLKNAHLHIEGK